MTVFYTPGRPYVMPSVVAVPLTQSHDPRPTTWLEIDVGALSRNFSTLQSTLGGVGVIGVVKSDAYGLGLVPMATELVRAGVGALGVGNNSDAMILRGSGIRSKIIVIYPCQLDQLEPLLANDVEITITNVEMLRTIAEIAMRLRRMARVHIQIETGMHHYGADRSMTLEIIEAIRSLSSVELAGLSTHFAAAGSDDHLTRHQLERFKDTLRLIKERGVTPTMIHCANSAAVDVCPDSWSEEKFHEIMPDSKVCVRVGSMLYGLYKPTAGLPEMESPIRRLVSHVIEVKSVPAGASIGYFGDFKTSTPMKVGIVPVGWGSNGFFPRDGVAMIHNQEVSIIGSISANTCVIDVTNMDEVSTGQEVILFSSKDIDRAAQRQAMFASRFIASIGTPSVRGYVRS